ncbi:hypothetical protein Tco_0896335 [Tanacetum coccineum]
MDSHGNLREGTNTRVDLEELRAIMKSSKGTMMKRSDGLKSASESPANDHTKQPSSSFQVQLTNPNTVLFAADLGDSIHQVYTTVSEYPNLVITPNVPGNNSRVFETGVNYKFIAHEYTNTFSGIGDGDNIRVSTINPKYMSDLSIPTTKMSVYTNPGENVNDNTTNPSVGMVSIRDGFSASFGESIANSTMNPSRSYGGEGVSEVGSTMGYPKVPFPNSSIGMDTNTFPDGDDSGVSTHAGRFVSNLSTMEGALLHTNMGASSDVHEGIRNFAANSSKDIPQQQTNLSTTIGTNSSQWVHDSNVQTHSIDDVAKLFGVPFNIVKDIDDFVQELQLGKHELWPLLSKEKGNEITNIVCNKYVALSESADNPSDPIVQSMDTNTKSTSYAGAAGASTMAQPQVNSNFRPLVADPVFNDVNISIPRKVIEKVSAHLEHTLYGYFIGKRLAFPVVEYYARNNWGKHGLKGVMMNTKGFFFFTKVGLEAVLEWSLDDTLIATFIGKPIMLDSYTSFMCKDLWGKSSFARCLIEVNSNTDLVDVVTIGIPSLTGDDFTKETIRVEYEWRPPRCDECKIFGHVHDHCSKKVVSPPIVTTSTIVAPTVDKSNDDFQTVGKKKKRKGKSKSTNGEDDEEVENVYDESANLFKTGGSSSSMAAAG